MRLGTRHIGTDHPPLIIAEIGVNHDGSVDGARHLIDIAASCRADAVKFQFFTADRLLSGSSSLAKYQHASGATDAHAMLRGLELSVDAMTSLVEHATTCGVFPIVTVFSVEHVALMQSLPWAAYKVASPDIVNKPLLEALASLNTPLIISTGAANFDEIEQAIQWLCDAHSRLAMMQCISAYPTPTDLAHLAPIATLRDRFNVPVGYSDHTTDERTGGLAVACGASLLEKHITYSRAANGPDHAMSLEWEPFDRYVKFARLAHTMLGSQAKSVHSIEQDVRTVSRQSIVATKPLRLGHVIHREDLTIKRPGTGLSPASMDELVGATVTKKIEADQPIPADHIRMNESEHRRFAGPFPTADAA